MAYEMRGQFLEACDCFVPCPCWFVRDPDEDECTGVIAWYIERGRIEGVDVSGLSAASVSQHQGPRGAPGSHPKMRIALLIDETATALQAEALAEAFSGRLGGPLAELAEMAGNDARTERAAIGFTSDGGHTTLHVDRVVQTDMTPIVGTSGRVITIGDSVMAVLLGPVGEAGRSRNLTLDVPQHHVHVGVQNRSATRGRFVYVAR